MRVLLVDDTKSVHAYTKSILRPSGIAEFVDAYNGQEALDVLSTGEKFDLVLLDWEMPIMDGVMTLLEIKKRFDVPVIMVTTKNDKSDILKMLEAGADEYVIKPFTSDILISKIKLVLPNEIKDVG